MVVERNFGFTLLYLAVGSIWLSCDATTLCPIVARAARGYLVPMQRSSVENMETSRALPRSPELMNREDSALLVVDAQERLLALVQSATYVRWNIRRLVDAAAVMSVPAAATEQYPEKLGATAPEILKRLGSASGKLAFSACESGEVFERWREGGRYRVLVCGIETHVCVLQTALDLVAAGFETYVAVDAVSARHSTDHETALRRMESAGVMLTTTETAMFEWCRIAGTPEFKQISALVKEPPP
jgi:nicotinamidase-related amidase